MLRNGIRATSYADVVRQSGLHEELVHRYAEDSDGVMMKVLEDIEQDVIEAMIADGTLLKLNERAHPASYLHRSHLSDVARTEHLTPRDIAPG